VFWVKYDGTAPHFLTHPFGGGVLPSAMEDITDDLISVEWSRGGADMLVETPPGTATLRLRNESRQWEPGFAGPHDPIVIGETFVIGCTWLEADYTLFYGFSDSVDVIWDKHWANNYGEVEIRLVDALTLMQQNYTTSSPFEETVSVRITKVLDKIRYPAAFRNITAGGGLCKKHGVLDPPVTALEYIYAAVGTGGGTFFIDRRGFATYGAGTSTGLVFGDLPPELTYTASSLHAGRETQVSKAKVTPILGVAQTASGSVGGGGKHERLSLSRTDAEALSLATSIASGALPKKKMEGFQVMPAGSEDLWSAVIPLDLRQSFTVRRRPPGGGSLFSLGVRVEGLKWNVQGHPYETTVNYDLRSLT
jgi:hypothetical protein